MIEIYTDGAYNPGLEQGGWGVVILKDTQKLFFSGTVERTTNNRMELTAALEGILRTPQDTEVTVYTDSQYLFGTMTKGWRRLANRDLWEKLDSAINKRKIRWELTHDARNPLHKEAHKLAIEASRGRIPPPFSEIEERQMEVRMVDITQKQDTERVAVAKGVVAMNPETLALIDQRRIAKGDVLSIAQMAGIMAAKKTSDLIPLCHPLILTDVDVELKLDKEHSTVEITATVKSTGKTGVEMEALTAVAGSALTIYDMCKPVERGIKISHIRLIRKSGGKSGTIVLE